MSSTCRQMVCEKTCAARTRWIFTESFFCLVIFLLCSSAEGNSQVIGSTQPILAAVGDDIILPCHLDPLRNVEDLTVEWTRPDLPVDPTDRLNRRRYVHVYRRRRENLHMKNPSYRGRTLLSRDGLRHGDISLKLVNVTLDDAGMYRCFIPKLTSSVREAVVQLVVESPPQTTEADSATEKPTVNPDEKEETDVKGDIPRGNAWIPAVIITVLLTVLIAVIYGVSRFVKCKPQKQPNYDMVEVCCKEKNGAI